MLIAIYYKSKQFSLALIKIGLVVGAFYLIYNKLFLNSDYQFDDLFQVLTNFEALSYKTVLFLVMLSISNWFFEILKWQNLVSSVRVISFKDAKEQSLGALTASLLTPNRIGEYGAKAMYYTAPFRKKVMLLNLLGNTIQMVITTIFGSLGLMYFSLNFEPTFNYMGILIWFSIIVFISLILIAFFRIKGFQKQKRLYGRLINFIKTISQKTILITVGYSVLRYLIFSFQFYFLLTLFGGNLTYLEAMAAISSMYLLSSIMPSVFIFDVVIKGGIAVYIFGLLDISQTIVLAIVMLMWILNFVLPSIIGSYHVLHYKLPKSSV